MIKTRLPTPNPRKRRFLTPTTSLHTHESLAFNRVKGLRIFKKVYIPQNRPFQPPQLTQNINATLGFLRSTKYIRSLDLREVTWFGEKDFQKMMRLAKHVFRAKEVSLWVLLKHRKLFNAWFKWGRLESLFCKVSYPRDDHYWPGEQPLSRVQDPFFFLPYQRTLKRFQLEFEQYYPFLDFPHLYHIRRYPASLQEVSFLNLIGCREVLPLYLEHSGKHLKQLRSLTIDFRGHQWDQYLWYYLMKQLSTVLPLLQVFIVRGIKSNLFTSIPSSPSFGRLRTFIIDCQVGESSWDIFEYWNGIEKKQQCLQLILRIERKSSLQHLCEFIEFFPSLQSLTIHAPEATCMPVTSLLQVFRTIGRLSLLRDLAIFVRYCCQPTPDLVPMTYFSTLLLGREVTFESFQFDVDFTVDYQDLSDLMQALVKHSRTLLKLRISVNSLQPLGSFPFLYDIIDSQERMEALELPEWMLTQEEIDPFLERVSKMQSLQRFLSKGLDLPKLSDFLKLEKGLQTTLQVLEYSIISEDTKRILPKRKRKQKKSEAQEYHNQLAFSCIPYCPQRHRGTRLL